MSIHEGCAYDTVISVDIDEVEIDLILYSAESYGNLCPIADLESATDASKLENYLFFQLDVKSRREHKH